MLRSVARAVLALVQIAAATYLALMAFLLTGWMVDDNVAARMTRTDWVVDAATRFAMWLAAGVGFGAVATAANRAWLRPRGRLHPVAEHLGVILAVSIISAALAGAIRFVVEKPWM